MLYLISYDLVAPGQAWQRLDKKIAASGGKRVLNSQWVALSDATADAVYRDLAPEIDQNDRLLVTELTKGMVWGAGKLLISDAQMEAFRVKARC